MKNVFSIFILLMSISLISAESLSESLSQIDQSLVILIALFVIIFSLIFLSLKKVFKENITIVSVISSVVSFWAIYGINKSGFNVSEFILGRGLSRANLSLLLFLVITIGIVYMFIKLKMKSLLILGLLSIGLSFFVYAKNFLILIGVILIAIWFFIEINKNNESKKNTPPKNPANP